MTDFRFCGFTDYNDGKLAHLETMESGIPVNIFAEPDSDFSLQEGDICSVDIYGEGSNIRFFTDEKAYSASGSQMAPVSMIPMGTFPADPEDKDFQGSPHIIFTGKVIDGKAYPDAVSTEPNFCLMVETLEMILEVYVRYEGNISTGGILSGVAWLYGDILKKQPEEDEASEASEALEESLLQAAGAGDTNAMTKLGIKAEKAGDYEQAYTWYRKACELGDPDGKFNYANMYHWGWYVEQDYELAGRYFRELAEKDYIAAFFYMGLYLQNGLGVKKDEKEAVKWFERGEQCGDPYSTTMLGRSYCLGLGVEKDEKKGLEYYLKAAERGDVLAFANIGYAYEYGQGTDKDPELALKYYLQGAVLGEEHCIEAIKRIDQSMTGADS